METPKDKATLSQKRRILRLRLPTAIAGLAIGLLCATGFAQVPRDPAITIPPKYEGNPAWDKCTVYRVIDEKRVRDDVLRVTSNGSFVSRCIRMLSRDGKSKHFEMITGQDGVTFGISDFASDGLVLQFFQVLAREAPKEFEAAFGEHGKDLLSRRFVHKYNQHGRGRMSGDNGLIVFPWFRTGLDEILTNTHLHETQLHVFLQEPIVPCLREFERAKLKYEFTLAAMVGPGNTMGGTTVAGWIVGYLKEHPGTDEMEGARRFLEQAYLDPKRIDQQNLVAEGFSAEGVRARSEHELDALGHHGRRVYELFRKFPPHERRLFQGLGGFALQTEDRLP